MTVRDDQLMDEAVAHEVRWREMEERYMQAKRRRDIELHDYWSKSGPGTPCPCDRCWKP
jgi:hypothetical protein